MNNCDFDELDPGIRDTVRLLRAARFNTTDSGDGKSKPAEWFTSGDALPYPHVACTVLPSRLADEADRMASVLGESWTVEASYVPGQTAILFARGVGQ